MKSVKITSNHFSVLEKMKLGEIDRKNLYIKTYEKGEYIFYQNEEIKNILIIYSGKVGVTLDSSKGHRLLLAIYSPNSMLGDIEFFNKSCTVSNAQALSDTAVICISYSDIEKLRNHNEFIYLLGQILAKKLTRNIKNNSINILNAADIKIAAYIAGICENNIFDVNLSKLSELLGISYRHLLRRLKAFCENGYLLKIKDAYKITDLNSLKELAGDYYITDDWQI